MFRIENIAPGRVWILVCGALLYCFQIFQVCGQLRHQKCVSNSDRKVWRISTTHSFRFNVASPSINMEWKLYITPFVGHLWSVFCVINIYLLATKVVFVLLQRTSIFLSCCFFSALCSVLCKASLILPLYVLHSKHCSQPCLDSSSLWALDPIKRPCWFYIFRRRGDI